MVLDKQYFELTEDHLKLIDKMYLVWNEMEYGAPAIDPKRPYGNGSVENDIAEILGWAFEDNDSDDLMLSDRQEDRAYELHQETQIALQIILRTRSFVPGRYVASLYDVDWKLEVPE